MHMRRPISQEAFQIHTKRVVERTLRKSKCADFDELLQRLPGICPTEVIEALNALGVSIAFRSKFSPMLLQPRLPLTHPGDCAWRFTAGTTDDLARQCLRATTDGETIVMLGVPEVFLRIRDYNPCRKLVLVDKDCETVDVLYRSRRVGEEFIACDLMDDPIPSYNAALVLIDPPWYLDSFQAFTWVASRISRKGAQLLLPLPGVGTRPEMVQERRLLSRWLRSLSYKMEQRTTRVLVYDSPFFEQNALRAAGVQGVDGPWRRCDLASLTLSGECCAEKPIGAKRINWREFIFDGVRIRVRVPTEIPSGVCDPRLVSLVKGDILPSVSSRHPLRSQIKVWTSGNRVFGCESVQALLSILGTFSARRCTGPQLSDTLGPDLGPTEHELVCGTVDQLKQLLTDERNDWDRSLRSTSENIELEDRSPLPAL